MTDKIETLTVPNWNKLKDSISEEDAAGIGDAIGVDWSETDMDQFRVGIAVELEHGLRDMQTNVTDGDLMDTARIALAHLKENSEYYQPGGSDVNKSLVERIASFVSKAKFSQKHFRQPLIRSKRLSPSRSANKRRKEKKAANQIDDISKQGGLIPPEPGLIFDRDKHRWVKPENLHAVAGMDRLKPQVIRHGSDWVVNVGDDVDHKFSSKRDAQDWLNEWAASKVMNTSKKTPEQLELEEYNRRIHGIKKALHFKDRAEAEAYGIKLPDDFGKPKNEPKPQPRPKLPEVKPTIAPPSHPKGMPSRPSKSEEGLGAKDVARVISPKGPYQNPMQVVDDVQESSKLGKKIADFVARKSVK